MRLASVFFPRFPVQRRVVEQPSLAGQPLVLFVDERGAQRVRFASGAALKRGIRSGMTVASASALEPSVVKLRYEPLHEAKALASLGERLLPLAPGFQLDAPEGFWLDASASHLHGDERAWSERVLAACRAVGLRGKCVVGAERFTTQAVARWGNESVVVLPERGGDAVAGLPLVALERGWLGEGASAPFRTLGLTSLGELAGLPSGALVGRFGAGGLLAARLCRGEDDSRFVAEVLPEVMDESVQLDWPAEALEPVLFALKMLVDRVCGRLQGRQLAAVRLLVTVGLEGGSGPSELTVPIVLARASAESRLLVELIRHRLTDLTVQQPIVSLHLKVEEASDDHGRQLVLGDAPAGEVELEVVMSRLRSALGDEALFSAAPVASHRPEDAWTVRAFSLVTPLGPQKAPTETAPMLLPTSVDAVSAPVPVPVAREEGKPWPKAKAKVEQHGAISFTTLEHRPTRLFAEPARLEAELSADGALEHVQLAGRRRKVELLVGPERLVGAWWSPEPYTRDYYRLQLEGVGQLWIYRDGRDGAFYAQGAFD